MLYELRHYDIEGERGLSFVIQRFADHVLLAFDRAKIEPIGFWTVDVGERRPRLTYLLRWDDLAHRESAWDAFESDSEWNTTLRETNIAFGGSPIRTITNSILKPLSFAPLPRKNNQSAYLTGGVYELRILSFADYAMLARGAQWLNAHAMPLLGKHRMHLMGAWTTWVGISPRLTYILLHESAAERERSWNGYDADADRVAVEEHATLQGRSLVTGEEIALMRATEFSGWR